MVKRQKEEEEENVMPTSLDPLENGFINHAQREQERMNDRLLKKTYSKKNKQVGFILLLVNENVPLRSEDLF